MKLPIILANAQSQRFSCAGCTNCCRELVVHLTVRDREKIDAQGWAARLDVPAYVPLGREFVLNHRAGGGCVFLSDDGKCRIHAEFGGSEKPLACQLYPFTLEPGGWAVRSGVRFDCPTVGVNGGATLASQIANVTAMAEQVIATQPLAFGAQPVFLKGGRELSPDEQDAIIERLDAWIARRDVPLAARLAGLLELADALDAARLENIRDERFVELLDLLMGELPVTVESIDAANDGPPSSRQMVLFRQMVFAHCEYVDLERARAPWMTRLRNRFDQLQRARRFSNGARSRVSLFPGGGPVHLDAIDAATAQVDASDVDELLTRYLRNRIVSQTVFGPGYYGWPVVDGMRALVLCIAAIGWMARYVAVRRGADRFTLDDLRRAIAIIDRTAGRAAELGARSARLRIRYLQGERGIERLLKAYAPVAD